MNILINLGRDMSPITECHICNNFQKEAHYVVQRSKEPDKSFCSKECYRLFLQNVLASKDGAKDLVQKRKFRIIKKVRDHSPDSIETPKNSPENSEFKGK